MNQVFEYFKRTTGNMNWENVKKKLISTSDPDASKNLSIMKDLIIYRDNIDYYLYKMAVEKLFPATFYNIDIKVDADTICHANNQLLVFKKNGYIFEVSSKCASQSGEKVICQIIVNATGSSTVTSTLDTSILVKMKKKSNEQFSDTALISLKEKSDFFSKTRESISKGGADFEGRVTNAVLAEYNIANDNAFNMSSTEHRDSNAYLDTITDDDIIYAKFDNTDINNPSINGVKVFTDAEFEETFAKNKYTKYLQELSASLVLLRQHLSFSEWLNFKNLVLICGEQTINQKVGNDSFINKLKLKQYHNTFAKDIQDAFRMAAETARECEEEVFFAANAKSHSDYSKYSPLNRGSNAFQKDVEASVKNVLYVKYSEMATTLNGRIIDLRQENADLILKANQLARMFPGVCKTSELEELKEQIKNNLCRIANYQNEKQYFINKSLAFSNKAYTNRSAVYHVVRGMQEKRDITISEQVIMGSALQQVAFKFAHVKELREHGKKEDEIAYLTAKYGYRIYNLMFNDSEKVSKNVKASSMEKHVSNDEIESLVRNGTASSFKLLDYLKSKSVKASAHTAFTRDELLLLNSDAEIITTVKKQNIPDNEKPAKALILIRERLNRLDKVSFPVKENITMEQVRRFAQNNEKELFLLIAANLIGLSYASKFQRKQKGWGKNIAIDSQLLRADNLMQFAPKCGL